MSEKFMKMEAEVAKIRDKAIKESEENSFKFEQEVLAEFWKNIGDYTTTYFEALQAVSHAMAVLRKWRKSARRMQPGTRRMIGNLLIKCIKKDMDVSDSIEKHKEEINDLRKDFEK